jgi:hypothetical protein
MVLTDKAIYTAHAGAKKMANQDYRIERSRYWEHRVTITNPKGTRYVVGMDRPGRKGFCACPFHADNGICKHRIFVMEAIDVEDAWIAANEERLQAIAEEGLDVLEQGNW